MLHGHCPEGVCDKEMLIRLSMARIKCADGFLRGFYKTVQLSSGDSAMGMCTA
ncbi:hypothetical protein FORC77_2271 [Vibrio vulnificus]|nr:hypothetical protein FORC77_2271 [Vibrio vulnificus]